ncbi:lysR substrate binding domain protein [Mycobacterium avium MAV_061107_1842]|nr:lysR substrate binding domain protein [Mycobacterium avium MAV_061107_1842]
MVFCEAASSHPLSVRTATLVFTRALRRLRCRGVFTTAAWAWISAASGVRNLTWVVLTVGATEHGADVMLAGLSGALRDRLPDLRVRFRLDRNVSLADSIDRGLVDVAIMLDGAGLDRANASGLVRLQWVSARTLTIAPKDPLPLVIFSEPCTLREPAFAILDSHRIDYEIAAECGDLSGLYAAVRSGLGVALLPMIGKFPDGLGPAEGLPPANNASILVRGRTGIDPALLSTVDTAVRDLLATAT